MVLSCLVSVLPNTPGGVKQPGLGYNLCIKACLKGCGSGIVAMASGRELQSHIIQGKYEKL